MYLLRFTAGFTTAATVFSNRGTFAVPLLLSSLPPLGPLLFSNGRVQSLLLQRNLTAKTSLPCLFPLLLLLLLLLLLFLVLASEHWRC